MAETADILTASNLIFLATNVTKKLDHYNFTCIREMRTGEIYGFGGWEFVNAYFENLRREEVTAGYNNQKLDDYKPLARVGGNVQRAEL